ncbi:MAG TPA: DUF885 domain-containing protein [Casimicrobiaceae bacterium]|nr:DUF885 domain-containing protein [Casimicrobiaceae bacterium]
MVRTIFKWLARLLVAALVVASVFVVNLVWFRPFSLNLFYEKAFVTFVLEQPELLTSIGIAEQFGYRRHNAHLDDLSIAKKDRDYATWHGYLADLQSYDLASQTPQQRLSTRVMTFYVDSVLEGEPFRFHDYPVNQLFGVQNDTPEFLINQHRIADRRGAEDYLSRLGEVGRKFDQALEGLALREQKAVIPPRFVIERVLEEMRAFAGTPARDNPLYTNFATKVAALPDVAASEKETLDARCAEAIEMGVLPAYRKLIAFMEAQLPRSTTDDGVWKLPDGDAYYAYRLRTATTTRMTPQQVHDLGLSEVARIEAEMNSVLAAQGESRPGETPAHALARLAQNPRFHYPNTEPGRKAALTDYATMLDDQLARSRAIIGLVPKARLEVQRVPQFKEKTAPGAYYNGPAIDGTRPGVFYANLRDMDEMPKFGMRTLALHEGIPGHHFQIALAQQQTNVPTFRQVLPFTAYMEGWALYAEWLGTELGVYKDDPYGDLGRLQAEMFRAVRLVVDTGIHYERWPREHAIAYMVEKTGMSEGEVVSEIERYIVNPGQACAYKLGMLSIRAARARAEAALGARFDAEAEKGFHDVVLGSGALPLEVLDEQVDAWIKTRAH